MIEHFQIADFGHSREDVGPKVTSGIETGTDAFRCPQRQANQEYDHRTDLWSLGIMIYEVSSSPREKSLFE